MCHGQSRTPVPTILDYPNILMRTSPIGVFSIQNFPHKRSVQFLHLSVSLQASVKRSGWVKT